MSANPSKDLNLNLDAVPLEDQDEICGAVVTRCSDTTSISVSETISEGRIDQVRVSGGEEDLMEPLIQGSDIDAEGNLKKDVDVPVASISVNGGGDEIEGDRFDGSLLQKVSCLEDDERKTGTEIVKVECSMKTTKSLVEKNQVVVVEGQDAAMLEEDILNPSCLVKNRSLETMGGSAAENAVIDAVTSVGVESFPNSDHRRSSMANPGTCENISYAQDEKQEEVAEADEMVSDQVDEEEILDSHSVEKNPNGGPCVTIDSDSIAVVTERVTETVRTSQDLNLDSEVQVVDACPSPPRVDQNMGTCDSELDTSPEKESQNKEVDIKTEAPGEPCKQDENQIRGSLRGNESNMGSLVVYLETCSVIAGNLNTGDEVANEDTCLPNESCIKGVEIKEAESDIDDNAADDATDVRCDGDQKIETTEQDTLFEQLENNVEKKTLNQASLKHGTASVKENMASYHLETEKEDKFSVSDLVWGKVKSHPWWPGQIFDPLDSSEYAKKYKKNDRFLVSYFGDQTFAWNKASSLKHFQTHFSQMEKQTNLKAFHDAVDCALDEVSRRVELGLSCSCTPEDAYAKIKSQVIKNSGIREEACIRNVVDKSPSVTLLEHIKLLESIKALALYPHRGGDRLELVIAQAQLVAFYRLKGNFQLPEFQVYGGLLESDAEHATPVSKTEEQATSGKRKQKSQDRSSRKRQHILENALNPRRKERRLSELMDGKNSLPYGVKTVADEKGGSKSASLSSGKKHKDVDSFSDNLVVQSRKQMLLRSRNSDAEVPTPHKVGDRIRRIASQLTGSPSVLKHSAVKVGRRNKKLHGDDVDVSPHTPERSRKRRIVIPKEYSSPDEMLSQLCLAARDPKKGYSFLTIIVDFFTDFRNSISLDHYSSGKLKQSTKKFSGGKTDARNGQQSNSKTGSAETCNYGNDSYWTDRIIQSSPEEQPLYNNRKRKTQIESSMRKDSPTFESKDSLELISTVDSMDCPTIEPENYFQPNPIMDSKQQNPDGKSNSVTGKPVDDLNKKYAGDFSPTALILNFTEPDSIPSEADLNKIFSRFGPLKETETEVLRKATRARVVFKSHNDAEVAFSSAGKFSIFGRTTLVSYQLAATEGRKNATSLEGNIS